MLVSCLYHEISWNKPYWKAAQQTLGLGQIAKNCTLTVDTALEVPSITQVVLHGQFFYCQLFQAKSSVAAGPWVKRFWVPQTWAEPQYLGTWGCFAPIFQAFRSIQPAKSCQVMPTQHQSATCHKRPSGHQTSCAAQRCRCFQQVPLVAVPASLRSGSE